MMASVTGRARSLTASNSALLFNVGEQLIGKSLNPRSQEIDASRPEVGSNLALEPSVPGRIREQYCLSACEWVQLGKKRQLR